MRNLVKLGIMVCIGVSVGVSVTTAASGQVAASYTVFPAQQVELGAQPVHRITLELKDVSVPEAVHRIVAQTGLALGWSQSKVPLTGKVTLALKDVSVEDALRSVLKGTGAVAKMSSDGETIMIVPAERERTEQGETTGSVVGRVVDSASGKGVVGATVAVQGTKLSTLTSEAGAFELHDVPEGKQVLTIKKFGYQPVARTVTVMSKRHVTMHVVLVPTATILSGMVTTATGIQQRREVGNDIVTLNVDSIQQVAPITSVTDLLESRVPGLTVLRSSGTPGDPARLRLRGASSVTENNDPIVIVDGIRVYSAQSDPRTANLAGSAVSSTAKFAGPNNYAAPSPIDQIDPNSIETIEVLKGPSASSLYGSDAANGVIVITTKHGQAGPAHWNASIKQGLSYYPSTYPVQTRQWGHGAYDDGFVTKLDGVDYSCPIDRMDNKFKVPGCTVIDSVTRVQVLNLPRWSPVGHGNTTSGSATVSGGVSALTYALTGSAGTDLGYLRLPEAMADAFQQYHGYAAPGWAERPDHYTTWGGSGRLTAQVKPKMQLTVNSNLFHGVQQRSSLERVLSSLQQASDTTGSNGNSVPPQNLNAYERATTEQLTFRSALSASWAPWSWLPLLGTAGLDIATGHDVALLARDIIPYDKDYNGAVDSVGRYGAGQKSSTGKTLNVSTTIPGWRGRLQTAVGFNLYSQSSTDMVGEQDTLELGVTTPSRLGGVTKQNVTGTTTYGWFFEPRLMLSQRFYLTPGFRLDGGTANGGNASVSGLPTKLTFASLFPKVNLSYVALDRQEGDARPLFGVLTLLRPRLALGSAGVQPTPGDRLRLLGTSYLQPGLGIQTLGNTQLRPERSFEVEGGLDAEAWHGRITMDLTHARKLTHDAIISVPIAPSVYGDNERIKLNIGEIRNTNTELSMSIRPIEGGRVTWSVGGSLSHNDNKVIQLDQNSVAFFVGDNSGEITGTRIAIGYPLFGRWARPIVGYADANGDGVIQYREIQLGDTAVYLGRPDPATTAALNTDLALFHGRLGVHANFAYQGEYSQVNGASGRTSGLSGANDPNATLGQQASYIAALQTDPSKGTDYGLAQTINAWRFQSLSINYVVPTAIAQRFRAPRMSVALQGSNLALWTNYRGKDPNVNAFPNGNATADGGQLAQPRTWSLMLTLGN